MLQLLTTVHHELTTFVLLCAALAAFMLHDRSPGSAQLELGSQERTPALAGSEETGLEPDELSSIDLSDSFVPPVFRDEPALGELGIQPYGQVLRELADERREPRDLELFGIFPTFRVLRERLLQEERHRCDARIEKGPLSALPLPWRASVSSPIGTSALRALQEVLRCDGLLSGRARDGVYDAATVAGVRAFQRRNMLVAWGAIDEPTRRMLALSSMERDFQAVLRALRERVVAATGLIEDGSAGAVHGDVVGRQLDDPGLHAAERDGPLVNGAPDRIASATDAAARALGWVSPEATYAWFAARSADAFRSLQVALPLPRAPAYLRDEMDLRVEIDRGDVWYDYPYRADSQPRAQPVEHRPTLVLFARTEQGEVPLVRWSTTIGGWQPEKLPGGALGLRYKESAAGPCVWREVIASPAWLPPPSTPDRELMRRTGSGRYVLQSELFGPGYASAYGLVMMPHAVEYVSRDERVHRFVDRGVRTHGSVSYRSILSGHSHGCHRLFNHLALRLAAFLLRHRQHVHLGNLAVRYARRIRYGGSAAWLRLSTRGYGYELTPPVPVVVLEGRIRGALKRPLEAIMPLPAGVGK